MKNSSTPLQPGAEYPQPDEERDTDAIIEAIIRRLTRDYLPGKTLREFHAKMHGCVKATFTVLPNLPQNFQHGFLVPGKKYEALIRFSNGNSNVLDDRKGDLRGMAIKLLSVPGQMLVDDERMPQSQDFLLVSYPTLMSSTVRGFRKNILALCNGTLALVLFGINPTNWPTIVRTLQSMKKCDSVLTLQYWSVSPYRLGPAEQAVKYSAVPVVKAGFEKVEKEPNFLRKEMQMRLKDSSVYFDFMIQTQVDPNTNPIENPCMEWKTPWTKVATIEIPTQTFDTEEGNAFGENLSFAPWHCLEEHKPLGGISRARKAAYHAIAAFRLERNKK